MINPHFLVGNSELKNIQNHNVIGKLYSIWKKLLKKNEIENVSESEAFMTGYFLGSNSVLKAKYLEEGKEPRRDNRIQNQIWR